MIIYRILNIINNKCYIGQSKFESLKDRYWGKWYKSTHSKLLKNAVAKYGEKNFAIQILEKKIDSFEKLDRLEVEYINKFNSVYPNGYNWSSGGSLNHFLHKKTKSKIGMANSKNYQLIDMHGKKLKIFNLKKFCRKNNLSYALMKNMVRGKYTSSQGYALIGTPTELIKNPNPQFVLQNIKNGNEVTFNNIARFCEKNNLKKESVQRLLANKRKSPYLNWIKPNMNLQKYYKEKRYINKKLISPEGKIFEIKESPYSFAKKHPPLDRKDIYMLIDKKTKSRKGGWKLYE